MKGTAMGGGIRKIKEVRKARNLAPARFDIDGMSEGLVGGGGVNGADEPQPALCERTHVVSFRMMTNEIEVGDAVEAALGSPPELVVADKTVGVLCERRQAQTLAACLSSGYSVSGSIVSIDHELGEGLASVAGVRTRR
jgi:hypothetical protein